MITNTGKVLLTQLKVKLLDEVWVLSYFISNYQLTSRTKIKFIFYSGACLYFFILSGKTWHFTISLLREKKVQKNKISKKPKNILKREVEIKS